MIAFAKLTVSRSQIEVSIGCNAELSLVFTYERNALKDSQLGIGWWKIPSLLGKWSHLFSLRRTIIIASKCLSPQMIEFMQKLSLKQVKRSNWNVEELKYIFTVKFLTYLWRLLQHLGPRSKQHDHFDVWVRESASIGFITIHISASGFWNASIKCCAINRDRSVLCTIQQGSIMTFNSLDGNRMRVVMSAIITLNAKRRTLVGPLVAKTLIRGGHCAITVTMMRRWCATITRKETWTVCRLLESFV